METGSAREPVVPCLLPEGRPGRPGACSARWTLAGSRAGRAGMAGQDGGAGWPASTTCTGPGPLGWDPGPGIAVRDTPGWFRGLDDRSRYGWSWP